MVDLIGGVHLNVELRVSHEELARWKPETIKAFLSGIATCLAAREVGAQSCAAARKVNVEEKR